MTTIRKDRDVRMTEMFRYQTGREPEDGDVYEMDWGRIEYRFDKGKWVDISQHA